MPMNDDLDHWSAAAEAAKPSQTATVLLAFIVGCILGLIVGVVAARTNVF